MWAMAPAVPIDYESAVPSDKPLTMFDKIWRDHLVTDAGGACLIYIDRHLVHEVTSPQAFEGLRVARRSIRRPDCTLVTVDHNIPTDPRKGVFDVSGIKEADSRGQVAALQSNVAEFGLTYFGMNDKRQGIVHVVGPEQGFTLPGTTVVCGDSHTSTHGAFGALAFGIGTSEVEHVLATQTLTQPVSKNMRIRVSGKLADGVESKDVILHIIGIIGTAGGTGYVIEFCGEVFEDMSIEARMSVCNMTIEAGARAGMVAPDDKTFAYVKGRPLAPKGADWEKAVEYWKSLHSDPGAAYDKMVEIDAADIAPSVTWGTSPEDVLPITGCVPDPAVVEDSAKRRTLEQKLNYMGLEPGQKLASVTINKAFIGSCTNSRIEDLRSAASVVRGRKLADGVYAMVVPGSGLVKQQAEVEGLDKVFTDAGFDWREPGCSMCLGMNPDKLKAQERCASTSNRNFQNRQGPGGRTHLVSPAMAAAAAVTGRFTDVRALLRPIAVDGDGAPNMASGAGKTDAKRFYTDECVMPAPTARVTNADAQVGSEKAAAGGGSAAMTFRRLEGVIVAPLRRVNVDTDIIIPAQFLKTIKRTGLGVSAFFPLRYENDGVTEKPDFVLNQEPYRAAQILVTLENFGCGSSREHAPWAIKDFGIRCVIAPSFADIFFNNCFKNAILPIVLPTEQVEQLLVDAEAKRLLDVDLETLRIRRETGDEIPFEVDSFRRHCLLNGLDDIGLTLQKGALIDAFEDNRSERYPWLDGARPTRSTANVHVSASKNPTYYARMALGFLAGLPATDERPARPPASKVVISATGMAIERAVRTMDEVRASGDAEVVSMQTELVESPNTVHVPRVSITIVARPKARAIATSLGVAKVESGGCCADKAPDW